MNFNDARAVEQVCYEIRLSDYPRGLNRARINELFNGWPPYSEDEAQRNGIEFNVNFLEGTGLAHDARSQYYNNFLKPGRFFSLQTDGGPKHKRTTIQEVVAKEMNRELKRGQMGLEYFEKFRSTIASDVLHGVGPGCWANSYDPCPDALGIEDIGIPARTFLTMKNLPFFYLYRSWTAPELMRLTRGTHTDPGWNKPLVERCLRWIDSEMVALMGSNWPEVWAPEKASERVKGDGGFYSGDQAPTIDTFDFYFYADDGKKSGWRRRMILDSWATPANTGKVGEKPTFTRRKGDLFDKADFLYTSRSENWADDWRQIASFQFADLSAVGPFQYHSVRSLGFLLFAVCHLQNRLRCKFNESVFEALLMYFRVKNFEDAQRALQVNLINRGFLDDTVQFIPANERFQVNSGLVELGLAQNSELINKHVSSYTQNPGIDQTAERKNKLQVMAELNAMTTLVGAGMSQAYSYAKFEYEEIKRRFMKANSGNARVLAFQARCLKQHVPESLLLNPAAWDCEPERTMGQGNKTMEMAIASQLMQYRPLYDPEPQRQILRDVTLAITDDPARAEQLVPDNPNRVTDAVHDAQLASARLLRGLPMGIKTGINHIEYVETLMADMAMVIQQDQQKGNMAPAEDIIGLNNMAQHINQHIAIIAQDPSEKARVKQYEQQLSKLMNEVKGFAQRLAQANKARMQNGAAGGPDPKVMAKVQEIALTGKAKRDAMAEARAQRAAERQVEFQMEMRRDAARHELDLRKTAREHRAELAKKGIETAANVAMARMKATQPTQGEE